MSRLADVGRALRHRNYRLFFSGQLVSLVGTWMQTVAESWLVYRLTGSAVLLGVTGFASQIPVFLLATVGGAVADRHDRHRIIVATQSTAMLLALTFAVLTLTGVVRVWHIVTIAALLGVVNAFDLPARQAFVTELVPRTDLMNAIALNSSMFNGARIVGPAIAGVLVAAVGEGWCFLLNAASYIAVLAGLFMIRLPRRDIAPATGSAMAHALEGFRWIGRTEAIFTLLALLGTVSLLGTPYAVLMPIFAEGVLHSGARGLGILMGASGVGALTGALVLASRRSIRGLGRWVAMAAAGFGASLIVFSFARSLPLAVLALVPVGFCLMVQMASSNTLIQSMVPDVLRGRVMAAYAMTFMGMSPLGALLAGALAKRVGAPATVAAGGACCILGASLFATRLPRLRAQARRLIVAQQAEAGAPADGVTASGARGERVVG